MTKGSDAWDARWAKRRAEMWERERTRLHIVRFTKEQFGMWHGDHRDCLCHAALDCKDQRCRAVRYFCHRPHCGPSSYKYGPLYALWAILDYFQAMIDGKGWTAGEFGKRFAHRKGA